jgi:hypothetical protein
VNDQAAMTRAGYPLVNDGDEPYVLTKVGAVCLDSHYLRHRGCYKRLRRSPESNIVFLHHQQLHLQDTQDSLSPQPTKQTHNSSQAFKLPNKLKKNNHKSTITDKMADQKDTTGPVNHAGEQKPITDEKKKEKEEERKASAHQHLPPPDNC